MYGGEMSNFASHVKNRVFKHYTRKAFRVHTTAPHVLLQPPPGLEEYAPPPGLEKSTHLCASHGIPIKAAPVRPRLFTAFSVMPRSLLFVPPMWEHILWAQLLPAREVLVPHLGTHNPVDADHRAGTGPFPKPRALILPFVNFGQSKPEGHGYIDTADSGLMHHQYRLSLLQWNPGPARRNPTDIVSAACGKFHAVVLQEASDHVPHISDQFMAYTGNTDLAFLLNKDTFEPDPIVLTYKVDSTSKSTWVWFYSSFEVSCGALLFLDHRLLHFAQYTFTMLWPKNVMHPPNFSIVFMDI